MNNHSDTKFTKIIEDDQNKIKSLNITCYLGLENSSWFSSKEIAENPEKSK